jgi:hypothetical protein
MANYFGGKIYDKSVDVYSYFPNPTLQTPHPEFWCRV